MKLTRYNIISYTTWNEWDEYEEDYKWCMRFLIERWIEWEKEQNDQDSTHTWLFS